MKKSYGLISAIVMLMACGSGMQASAAQSKKIATPQMQPVRSAQELADSFYRSDDSLAAFLDKEFKDKGYGQRQLIKGTKNREFMNNAQITTLVRLYEGITNLLAKASDGGKLKSLEDAAKDLLAQVSPALKQTPWFVQAQKSLPVSLKAGQANIATLQAEARAVATKKAEDKKAAEAARLAEEQATRLAAVTAEATRKIEVAAITEATIKAQEQVARLAKEEAARLAGKKKTGGKRVRFADELDGKLVTTQVIPNRDEIKKDQEAAAAEKAAADKTPVVSAVPVAPPAPVVPSAAQGKSINDLVKEQKAAAAADKASEQAALEKQAADKVAGEKAAAEASGKAALESILQRVNAANKIAIQEANEVKSQKDVVTKKLEMIVANQGKIKESAEQKAKQSIQYLKTKIDGLIAFSEYTNQDLQKIAQKVYQSLENFNKKEQEIKTDWESLNEYTKDSSYQSYLEKIRPLYEAVETGALGNQVEREGIKNKVVEQVQGANESLQSQKDQRALAQENPNKALKEQANEDANQKVAQATKKLAQAEKASQEVNALIDQIKAAKDAANQADDDAKKTTEEAKDFSKQSYKQKIFGGTPYSNDKAILDKAITAITSNKELIDQKYQEIRGSIKEVQEKIAFLEALNKETLNIWDKIKGPEVMQQKGVVARAQEEIGRLEGAAKSKIDFIINGTDSVSKIEVSLDSYKQTVEELLKAIKAHYLSLQNSNGFEKPSVTPTPKSPAENQDPGQFFG